MYYKENGEHNIIQKKKKKKREGDVHIAKGFLIGLKANKKNRV